MQTENIKPFEQTAVSLAVNSALTEDTSVVGHYTVTCIAADGTIRWEETFKNLSLIHISEPTRPY